MIRRTVTVTIEVSTNLDDDTLERRIENLVDPAVLRDQLLGDEKVRFRRTWIGVKP